MFFSRKCKTNVLLGLILISGREGGSNCCYGDRCTPLPTARDYKISGRFTAVTRKVHFDSFVVVFLNSLLQSRVCVYSDPLYYMLRLVG
jgi:hypothetical protein